MKVNHLTERSERKREIGDREKEDPLSLLHRSLQCYTRAQLQMKVERKESVKSTCLL